MPKKKRRRPELVVENLSETELFEFIDGLLDYYRTLSDKDKAKISKRTLDYLDLLSQGPSKAELASARPETLEILKRLKKVVIGALPFGDMRGTMSIAEKNALSKNLKEAVENEFRESNELRMFMLYSAQHALNAFIQMMELKVLHAGAGSFSGGPLGGNRRPETVEALKKRNADIRKEHAHYTLVGHEDPVGIIAKHFPKKSGQQLSRKQINRIIKDSR